ncbi:MAG: prolipoprotein diacylglyceryl transferase, partial [Deltaproteobacteria bacterium]|nr:prolipoprotein diacylglyceryl transferase [Deltaproteobacteria bacterium]
MFPYVYIDPDWIGGIEPFGVLVAIGVLFGAEMARRHALRTGLNLEELRRMAFYALVVGFISAHQVDLFFYQSGWFEEDPWRPFKLWAGISSYGGFMGGAAGLAFYIWVRSGKNKLPPDEPGRLAHAHPVAYADA